MKKILFLILFAIGVDAGRYEKIKEACIVGNAESCAHLGILYQMGQGVKKNNEKAKQYYSKSCNLDYANGCMNLANMYYFAEGADQNNSKAKQYYDKSCQLGNKEGCDNLKMIINEEETLHEQQVELEHLRQEQEELVQEAEVLDSL